MNPPASEASGGAEQPVVLRDRRVQRIHMQGAMMGLLVGDALGAQVEFRRARDIARSHPDGVREMEASEVWGTAPGQPTDDGELALSLADALIEAEGRFDRTAIANAYAQWVRSAPFDVGTTTWRGLHGEPDHASESNGGLMRVTPIALLYAHAGRDIAGTWAYRETGFTHPSETCRIASQLFVCTVATALVAQMDGPALYAACAHAAHKRAAQAPALYGAVERAGEEPPPSYEHDMGWVGIALGNALHWLAQGADFESALIETVRRGGDTDTNAAVCGALLGASQGLRAIPERWLRTVRTCQPDGRHPASGEHARPPRYWPARGFEVANALWTLAPSRKRALRELDAWQEREGAPPGPDRGAEAAE